jgi:hypothetical protein
MVLPEDRTAGDPEAVLLSVKETSLKAWPGLLKSVFDNRLAKIIEMLFVPIVNAAAPLSGPSDPVPEAKKICAEALAGMRARLVNTEPINCICRFDLRWIITYAPPHRQWTCPNE